MTPQDFKSARLGMGLTTSQLAKKLNISKRTIERIETSEGCSTVMALAMERLAQIVGHD